MIGPWVKLRIRLAGLLLTLLFCGIAYRAYGLQVHKADKYRNKAQRQHLRMVELPAPRGPILDAKGRELAVTADADSAFANPREVVDVAGTAEVVGRILDQDVRALEAKLATRRHFVWLERHVSGREASALREADLPGIYLTPEPRRFYPGKALAGPVLGFAGIDGDGLDGVELRMDDLLAGEKARFAALRDASGRVMMADGVVEAQAGATVVITIDRAIQHIAERTLENTVIESQAKAGTIVVLDVATGEVMAMASWPTYDPNAPGRAVRAKARNRAVTDAFEIGSVMKVFTIAAALDAGKVSLDEYIDVQDGSLQIGSKIIRDDYHDKRLTLSGIIKRSSNVGAVKVARRLGKQGLHDALLRYGFARETEIEMPGERTGKLRPFERWGDIGLASMSFGYGMTVTPIQVAAGFAAIGAGGIYHEPRIVREVRDGAGQVLYRHEPQGRRILQASTARSMLPMLASVFEEGRDGGTARSVEQPPFPVGGKTGTARKVDPETRQYSKELYVASFAGLAPINDPRIAVVVVVDEPRGESYYGAHVAGPAFVRVVDGTLRYLGVPPQGARGATASTEPRTEQPGAPPLAIDDAPGAGDDLTALPAALSDEMVVVPDFTGMSMGRALDLARSAGIEVELEGAGRVIEQYPPPGPVPRPGSCRIVLSPPRNRPMPATEPDMAPAAEPMTEPDMAPDAIPDALADPAPADAP